MSKLKPVKPVNAIESTQLNFSSVLFRFKNIDFSKFDAKREEEAKKIAFGGVTSSPGKAKNFKRKILNNLDESDSGGTGDSGSGGGIRFK